MSSKPLFSKEYYRIFNLFCDPWQLGREGKIKLVSGFIENIFGDRVDPVVDNQGTISLIPSSFFDRLKQKLSLTQDENLIAVHRRLKSLEIAVQNPLSPEFQAFKAEIHDAGWLDANRLDSNLTTLNCKFNSDNKQNFFTLTLVKVINVFRNLFQWKLIEFYNYSPIDRDLIRTQVIKPAMELTENDRLRSKYLPVIQNNSSLPRPILLNTDTLLKLEMGLIPDIQFSVDNKKFTLKYDRTHENYVLSYHGTKEEIDHVLPRSGNADLTVPFASLNVVETKPDGSSQTLPLQPFRKYQYTDYLDDWWHKDTPQTIVLGNNNEYLIPLSQGDLCLKFNRRS